MKTQKMILASLLGGLILLAGCQKEGGLSGSKDGQFRFGVSSKVLTRTEYGGDTETEAGKHQDINWTADDQIRIYSPTAARRVGVEKGLAADQRYYWADYKIIPDASNKTKATIENLIDDGNGLGNGLAWERGKESDEHTFYGIYPKPQSIEGAGNALDGCTGKFALAIPAEQVFSVKGNMEYAFMTAKGEGKATDEEVTLAFEPAFTAFEITLRSANNDVDLSSFRLFSESAPVSGPFTVNCGAETPYSGTSKDASYKAVTVDLDGKTASTATDLVFTIFALPTDLSDLSVEFTTKAGDTKKLALKKNGESIVFTGGSKHRIMGLALPDGSWAISLDLNVLDWEDSELQTTFSDQIAILGNTTIDGAIETGNNYIEYDNYEKYYQVRTLNMEGTNPHFEVTFKPIAPLGGYWTLQPEAINAGDLDYFDIRVLSADGEAYSTDLTGPILSQDVVLHIFPKNLPEERTKAYAFIFHSFFSPSQNFEPSYSADSEFQDIHGDGRFSYWRFTIAP